MSARRLVRLGLALLAPGGSLILLWWLVFKSGFRKGF